MISSLLRPKLLCWQRRWFPSNGTGAWRSAITVFLSVTIAAGLYLGSLLTLLRARATLAGELLPPGALLALLSAALFFALLFMDISVTLRALYTAEDLQLIIPAPVGPRRFFIARLIEVVCSPFWIAVVAVLPIAAAFASAYDAGSTFLLGAALVVLPLLSLPALIAAVLVTLFLAVMPLSSMRRLLYLGALAALIAMYLALSSRGRLAFTLEPPDPQQLIHALQASRQQWFPPYWAGEALAALLYRQYARFLGCTAVLYAVTALCALAAYLICRPLYLRAFSHSRSGTPRLKLHGRRAQRFVRWFLPFASPPLRAIFSKEVKTFSGLGRVLEGTTSSTAVNRCQTPMKNNTETTESNKCKLPFRFFIDTPDTIPHAAGGFSPAACRKRTSHLLANFFIVIP